MAADSVATPELELVTKQKMTIEDKIAELRHKRTKIEFGGGKQRIDKHHAAGLLTARERVEKLVDTESFQEIGAFAKHRSTYFGMADKELPADGVGTGCATVDGRLVHLASQDFTVAGGSAGEVHCAAYALRRVEGDTAHFLMIIFWETEEAIRAFAGDDISVAKYYDFDKNFLLELEPCSTHYEMYDK